MLYYWRQILKANQMQEINIMSVSNDTQKKKKSDERVHCKISHLYCFVTIKRTGCWEWYMPTTTTTKSVHMSE